MPPTVVLGAPIYKQPRNTSVPDFVRRQSEARPARHPQGLNYRTLLSQMACGPSRDVHWTHFSAYKGFIGPKNLRRSFTP